MMVAKRYLFHHMSLFSFMDLSEILGMRHYLGQSLSNN